MNLRDQLADADPARDERPAIPEELLERIVDVPREPHRAGSQSRRAAILAAASAIVVGVVVSGPDLRRSASSTADARTVLLRTADAAQSKPPTVEPPVRYVAIDERHAYTLAEGGATATATWSWRRDSWRTPRHAMREESTKPQFTVEGDARLAQRLREAPFAAEHTPPVIESSDTRGDTNLANDDLAGTPGEVRRRFESAITGGHYAPGEAPDAATVRTLVTRSVLVRLAWRYTTASRRGVLFRVLADLDTARALGRVELEEGRSGEAIELRISPRGGADRIVFDPQTAELLQWTSEAGALPWPRGLRPRGTAVQTLTFGRPVGVPRIGDRR